MAGLGRIARASSKADLAARLAAESTPRVVGYLSYNPSPGIYSRLERAVEAMPRNVRVQELPGLLKRYKDGVPGWELKETDLDSVIDGRDVVPREELLARVKERSPVYTHREVVLGGLGQGVSHGNPRYAHYSQGGKDYTEVLLTQPGARANEYGNHWRGWDVDAAEDAVAHARFDVHDGYLRVNELQSDLGIHNRKAREYADQNPQIHLGQRLNPPEQAGLPFPLEDAALELLLKRLNLYAAQHGLRGVEIASPRAIADKVGGKLGNYEHAYGKVAVGNQRRLGQKLGGMAEEDFPQGSNAYEENLASLEKAYHKPFAEAERLIRELRGERPYVMENPPSPLHNFDRLADAYQHGMWPEGLGPDYAWRHPDVLAGVQPLAQSAEHLYSALIEDLVSRGIGLAAASRQADQAMPRLVRLAEEQAARSISHSAAQLAPKTPPFKKPEVVYRGTMSDEMRRRIILEGIPAAVAGAIGTDQLLDRLDRESSQLR